MKDSHTYSLVVEGIGPVEVTVPRRGQGRPFLVLHGGGGHQLFDEFSALLAQQGNTAVLSPIHPGFAGTPRPEELKTIRGLAALYIALLEELDLHDVILIGNSIGGWISAEMALIGSDRISGMVLVCAVGIEPPDHPIVDGTVLSWDEVLRLSYYDPEPYRAASVAEEESKATDRSAAFVYGGTGMSDPSLLQRLPKIDLPSLVVWGASDGIVTPEYGQAYADAIPNAEFQVIARAGHVPQLETPEALVDAVVTFAGTSRSQGS